MRRTGILLVNLGTPESTSFWPMRRYLKEFLSDPRVIEAKGPVWWFIFNAIILTKRPKSSGRAYDKIWNTALDESPLKTFTRAQAEGVAAMFDENFVVDWAMRYGQPSIADRIDALLAKGCDQLLVLPLYPQYSAATTASVMDKVYDHFKTLRHQPELRTVRPYYDHPAYIEALANSIRTHHASLDWTPEVTIASLHGLPQAFIDQGDPYQSHCESTVALLRDTLGMDENTLRLSYQSRSGRTVWLPPDTEELLVSLAQSGVKNVSVITPGFASDCVETLEEIKLRAASAFLDAGGDYFTAIPSLNATPDAISMLHQLLLMNID